MDSDVEAELTTLQDTMTRAVHASADLFEALLIRVERLEQWIEAEMRKET